MAHVDLIRNDFEKDQQDLVARIYVDAGSSGLIVKDAIGRWEGNIFDVLGDTVRESGELIAEALTQAFHGPYLVATDMHDEHECPFLHDGPLPIRREKVEGRFVLPQPGGAGR